MDLNLVFVFLCIFFIFGAGGTVFWRMKKDKDANTVTPVTRVRPTAFQTDNSDALMSQWEAGECKTLSGTCGKGETVMTRRCVQEGSGDGKRCTDLGMSMTKDCYVHCSKPKDVIDWGHPNDAPGLPVGSPSKGWYDISGQGQPNDYCRWVGATGKKDEERFWACHIETKPYVKIDPSHISFSGGPANRAIPFHPQLIRKMCPREKDNKHLLKARDPDLQKSIANGMIAHCGARCVYDHRNPKSGWTYDGAKWNRVEDMALHACGVIHKDEYKHAVSQYEKIYDVRNAWSMSP